MKWLKLHADHGGGHQSSTTEYHPIPEYYTDEDEQFYLEDWCNQFRNVRATAECVEKLPSEVISRLLHQYREKIKYTTTIVNALEAMEAEERE